MKAMTMQKQHDWILPALALFVLLAAGLLFQYDQRLPETVWDGRDLIAGLEPRALTKISVKAGTKVFTMSRQGDSFVLESQNSAPVDHEKLNEILLRLGGAQITQVLGKKSDWEKFNVAESNAEMILELFTRGEKAHWKLYLGRSIPGKSGRAVRLEGKDEVFSTSDYLYINVNESDYVSKKALSIAKNQIKETLVFRNGSKLDVSKYSKDDLLDSLDPLSVKAHFRTGALPADLQNLEWSWQAQLLNENGLIYDISWAQKADRWFAKAVATTNQSFESMGPLLDLKLVTLKAEMDKFNQLKMPWIWELSSESVEKLTKGLMLTVKK